jgi:pilus assembly protein Flp/PilA
MTEPRKHLIIKEYLKRIKWRKWCPGCNIMEESGLSALTYAEEEEEMKNLIMRLWREEEGQDLVEYGLLLVLVALLSVALITTVGKQVSLIFSNAATALTSVNT